MCEAFLLGRGGAPLLAAPSIELDKLSVGDVTVDEFLENAALAAFLRPFKPATLRFFDDALRFSKLLSTDEVGDFSS